VKVVCGLGNPGPEYESTRHNVGWWVLDRLLQEWSFGRFHRQGPALVADGRVGDHEVRLLKPLTYMNRSGAALLPLLRDPEFNWATDLLVVVDDTALPVGRLRFRPKGSAGGHNGLKSIEAALHTREYARLRVGIGEKPPGTELADHVLSDFAEEDEAQVVDVLPAAAAGTRVWVEEGIEHAMRRCNR
jgi:PTH1 family peptidyl-tRNA hydrolase